MSCLPIKPKKGNQHIHNSRLPYHFIGQFIFIFMFIPFLCEHSLFFFKKILHLHFICCHIMLNYLQRKTRLNKWPNDANKIDKFSEWKYANKNKWLYDCPYFVHLTLKLNNYKVLKWTPFERKKTDLFSVDRILINSFI